MADKSGESRMMTPANCLGLLFGLLTAPAWAASDRPNIIFFLIDDIGTHQLGCYGNKEIPTPNIDALARDGMFSRRPGPAPPAFRRERC